MKLIKLAKLAACASVLFSFELHAEIIARTSDEQARIDAITAIIDDFIDAEAFENMPGGATTNTEIFTRDVFSQPSQNMDFEDELDFKVGNGFFRKLWVSSPASTKSSDGLGPIFNARACQNCHFKDGRGRPNDQGKADISLFLRLAIPGQPDDPTHPNIPDPVYGNQLQDRSNAGILAEGKMEIKYETEIIELADGELVELRKPIYSVDGAAYGKMSAGTQLSPRITPQMIGLGLIESIPVETILEYVDANDDDGDGISGRANIVWSRAHQDFMLGRFGYKAGNATIRDQSAAAFSGDMGLSTTLYPEPWGECTASQIACQNAPHGNEEDGVEITDQMLDLVEFYAANLAVPQRRDYNNPQVLEGKQVFYEIGCVACHRPKYVTHRYEDGRPQSFQLIWPYSDFLLHDMGDGLADNVGEFEAEGREWRTAPLWGIGFTELVSGEESYLHDGRARTLLEAILWHGGEAQSARDRVVGLSKEGRDALIAYLSSL